MIQSDMKLKNRHYGTRDTNQSSHKSSRLLIGDSRESSVCERCRRPPSFGAFNLGPSIQFRDQVKMSSNSHVCFCTLCKGQSQSSRYKIQQHAKLYGLWDPKRAKRSRIDESDSSASETSDGEMEECYIEAGIEEDEDFCDNLSANCDDDNGSWQEPLPSAKVSNTF